MVCKTFPGAHAVIERIGRRWYLCVYIEYWDLFEVEISEQEVMRILSKYQEITEKIA